MSGALWVLLGLQMRGWLRYLGRSLTTVRGVLLALLGMIVFVPWLISLAVARPGGGMDPIEVRRYGPALLIFYCVTNLLFSSHERALYFTPAEVQFLFPGPFGRRQVLAYKLLLTLLVGLPATLIMAAVFRVRDGWFPATVLGVLLATTFMQLFTTALALLASAAGETGYGRGRRLALLAVALAGAAVLWQAGEGVASHPEALLDTTAWRVVATPLRPIFAAMLAHSASELAVPALAALAVNAALVFLVFTLDAHYEEAAAATSARIYARIQRLRGKNAEVTEAAGPRRKRRWAVPVFPHLGGVGPIVWRQMVAGVRGLGRIVLVMAVMTAALLLSFGREKLDEQELVLVMLGILTVWMALFLTNLVPFDFRGDLDRIAILKTLPIVPWRLALGQLVVPTLLLSALQGGLFLLAAVRWPGQLPVLLVAGVLAIPYTFFLVAMDNLLFLLFPVRLMAATPGDFQALGRNVLLSMGKLFGLGVVGGVAALGWVVLALVTGDQWASLVAAWLVFFLAGAVLVPLVGKAFEWFDVGRDTPA
ncbi:MAG: putative ABC exporter domain-containing protein [Gemmataceae bacterium]